MSCGSGQLFICQVFSPWLCQQEVLLRETSSAQCYPLFPLSTSSIHNHQGCQKSHPCLFPYYLFMDTLSMDLCNHLLNLLIWSASLQQQKYAESQVIAGWLGSVEVTQSNILLTVQLTSILDQVAQVLVHLSFGNLQGWRFCSLSGQQVPGFNHIYCENFFLIGISLVSLSSLQFVNLPLILFLSTV